MTTLREWLTIAMVVAGASATEPGRAQTDGTLSNRESRSVRLGMVEQADTNIFGRSLSIDVSGVELRTALELVGSKVGAVVSMRVTEPAVLHRPVSLHAQNINAGSAFAALLAGTALRVESVGDKDVIVIPDDTKPAPHTAPTTATIVGTVRNAKTLIGLDGTTLRVAGTTLNTTSDMRGRYVLHGLGRGSYTITARRLGYVLGTQTISVEAGDSVTVDFLLTESAALLDKVVTTVTGDRSRLEIGNDVGTIDAAGIVPRTPVTELSDVIAARVPGVQVFTNGGLVGAAPQLNIRGQNSGFLSNQPLVYIDGARVDNSSAGATPDGGTSAGGFDNILPDEIESIEIAKGPAAASLYGTDAANGVILIKTKQGARGTPRWSFYGEQGMLTFDRSRFENEYYPWGHSLDGNNTAEQCTLSSVAAGVCAQDSVLRFSPLRNAQTSPVGTGYLANYGAQVAGGNETRYFLSGGYTDESSYLKMPDADRALIAPTLGGVGIPSTAQRPDGLQKVSGRGNLVTSVSSAMDLALSTSYLSRDSRIPQGNFMSYGVFGPGDPAQNDGWAYGARPGYFFLQRHDQQLSSFVGSSTMSIRPLSWLTGHVTGGVNFSSTYTDELTPANEVPFDPTGERVNSKDNLSLYTLDAGFTGTLSLPAGLTSRTSVGGQYNRRTELINTAGAINLFEGSQSVAGGAIQNSAESNVSSVVAGAYVEEMIGVAERVFITGAVRYDGASSFGRSFDAVLYPKAQVSWLALSQQHGPLLSAISSLRLRVAYGEAGVQPSPTAALPEVTLGPAFSDGLATNGVFLGQLGNPNLKPETQKEFEGGFELALFNSRVNASATYYHKRSSNALEFIPVGNSIGGGQEQANVGAILNQGYELQASARVVDLRALTWDLNFNGSLNQSRVISVNPAAEYPGGFGEAGIQAGYPLFSYFDYPILSYTDKTHAGVVTPADVVVGSQRVFAGQAYPKTQFSAGTQVTLLSHLTVSTLFDYRGGFKLANEGLAFSCLSGYCAATSTPGASLKSQAAAIAVSSGAFNNTFWGYYQDGSFLRWRELAVTYDLPVALLRHMPARTLSVTLSARNIGLWTRYNGVDPEVVRSPGLTPQQAYEDQGSVPLSQFWILRLNLGL